MAKKHISLPEQLKQAIVRSGLSLYKLGEASGVDSGRLSRFMRGERDLTLKTTAKLCDVLGLKFCPTGEPGIEPMAKPKRRRKGV
jgi:transcriptional regulator with XRE-family HTH domain